MAKGSIEVLGARVHNLKNIDVKIPRESLTVITGLSGSGKSSLAFDTLFAEGQRRYIETFSSYARNFLGGMERPDVDKVSGLSPVISIEQKTVNRNPRSTVGTTTDIYDYLRLLFARAADAYSYLSGERMVRYTEEQILEMLLDAYRGRKILLLAPLVHNRKGHYRELFESVRRKGYLTVRVDGELKEAVSGMRLDRYKNHDIEVVIDKLMPSNKDDERLRKSVSLCMQMGDGLMMVLDVEKNETRHLSKRLMDPVTGLSYSEPAPHNFSFNSPQGACPVCKGLGVVSRIDMDKVIPDRSLSIAKGAIAPLGKFKNSMIFWQIGSLLEANELNLDTPVSDIPEDLLDEILNGSTEKVRIKSSLVGTSSDYYVQYEGIVKYIEKLTETDQSASAQKWAEQFACTDVCPECHGDRLSRESLSYRIQGKNIAELCRMDIRQLYDFLETVPGSMTQRQELIARDILKEIRSRLGFLMDVGLEYLSLGRPSATLSGGESQRIRLTSQIGSRLVNVLYILDEPSIGLHQRDNQKLINSLKQLRDIGNTVVVVEHDRDMMLSADYLLDMGPGAGTGGGKVLYQGDPKGILSLDTPTAQYLSGRKSFAFNRSPRPGSGERLVLHGARGNNLRNLDVSFPLGKLICITGVSGSGKSSLINQTLQPLLSKHFYRSLEDPLPYDSIEGLKLVDKVVSVDQSPLGRTPRSNPVTYTGIFSDIRNLFVSLPEARLRGYKPGRFSFNVKGGRCETCQGNGYKVIEMNFLPDVMVPCETCHGRRYNHETLEVRYKGKSISDVLDMSVDEAVSFFQNVPAIQTKIKVLQDVGLGYLRLGQPSNTLSGGESQRVKLSSELSKKDTGRTVFILDEPTTGLHFEDIRLLMDLLNRLVDKGNTVIVIEHNMDVIKMADHVIDLGPEGGSKGGYIVAEGTPLEIAQNGVGHTAQFLKRELEMG